MPTYKISTDDPRAMTGSAENMDSALAAALQLASYQGEPAHIYPVADDGTTADKPVATLTIEFHEQ